ncbi:MAG: hypothetical protein ACI88G_002030 [Woeseiaceae bacterium]|jgi:hypothetical protein
MHPTTHKPDQPSLILADTQSLAEHQIVVSEISMAAGAELLDERFSERKLVDKIAQILMSDGVTRVFAISDKVEFVSEDESMTFHFRIILHSLKTAESGCRNVLWVMAQVIPDLIGTTFVLGDTHSHRAEELQRAVLDQTTMLYSVGQIGVDQKVTVKYSFSDGSYLASETPDTDE